MQSWRPDASPNRYYITTSAILKELSRFFFSRQARFFIKRRVWNTSTWVCFRDVKQTFFALKRYIFNRAPLVDLPKASTIGARRLKPAWNQHKASSAKTSTTWTEVLPLRSKVLMFLSFQSIQQVKHQQAIETLWPCLSSFQILFLASLHQSTNLFTSGPGASECQPNFRRRRNQISLENE